MHDRSHSFFDQLLQEKAKYWVDQALTIKRGAPLRIILAGNKTDLLPSSSEFVVPHEVPFSLFFLFVFFLCERVRR
jgi:hypothetical protein